MNDASCATQPKLRCALSLMLVSLLGACGKEHAERVARTSLPPASLPTTVAPSSSVDEEALRAIAAVADSIRQGHVRPVEWGVRWGESEMDGSRSLLVSRDAEAVINAWPERVLTPTLFLRCEEGRTSVFVRTGASANPELGRFREFGVRLRFDDGQPVEQVWHESTNGEALFAPRPLPLIRRLVSTDTLRVEFTPYHSSPQIARFAVTGLGPHATALGQLCGWELDTMRVRTPG